MLKPISLSLALLVGAWWLLAGPAEPVARAAEAQPSPGTTAPVSRVFDVERSVKEDVVYFRNKDVLRGEVLSETVTTATQYGQLTVPVRRCAALSFEGARANTEALVTINDNRITGIVTDRIINFKIGSSGEKIPIRKEKVRYILLKRNPDEADFIAKFGKSDVFFMANGDILTGEAVERKIAVRTDSAKVPVAFDEMKKVEMQGGDNVTAVVLKNNGDTMRGTLDTDEMSLALDIGVKVDEIYKDKFGAIYIDQALAQAPALFGIKQPVAGESEGALTTVGVPEGDKVITLDLGNKVTMKLALIPAGDFIMGSPGAEKDHVADEEPQRRVKITKSFYMGITEVTQEQYMEVMENNPSNFAGKNLPVEKVSWDDAVAFCKKLSQKTGKTVRLPTEAEWEYACRAGSAARFSFGDDDKELSRNGWYAENSDAKTHAVGQKKPNAWGLYDMHGNVWEWCSDWYQDSYKNLGVADPTGPEKGSLRVLRGGSWSSGPRLCRSAYRGRSRPAARHVLYGFRVAVSAGVDLP